MDCGLGITNWNEWMKKHHIKIASDEEARKYQEKKRARKQNNKSK